MFVESITTEEIYKMPLAAFEGRITVIDRVDKAFNDAVRYLGTKKVIGFDTESRPSFSSEHEPYGVSLLQLSGAEKAFLFRVKDIGMQRRLIALLSNPNVTKVGAAVHDDLNGLRKIREFTPAGFVDLQHIVSEWGIRDKSVKKMAAIILGVRISKTQQLSNWEADTLTIPQREYASIDAWACLKIYRLLEELRETGDFEIQTVEEPIEETINIQDE